jgi:spermidine dehydrogenase
MPAIQADTREEYDLVVVGGGISGLAAAHLWRRALGDRQKILILDNHDDFGGHAKGNEFEYNGRTFIGSGGTMRSGGSGGSGTSGRSGGSGGSNIGSAP